MHMLAETDLSAVDILNHFFICHISQISKQ